jgi:hypothetical protein
MRISKADGNQTLDPQRDPLLAAGVEPGHLHEDQASSKRDNRPGLEACLRALRQDDTEPPRVSRKPFCLSPTQRYGSSQAGYGSRGDALKPIAGRLSGGR